MTTLRCKSLKSYFPNAVASMAWGLTLPALRPVARNKQSKITNNYVKTDRSTGRAQSEAITRARSAESASEDPSEVYAPDSSNNKSQ